MGNKVDVFASNTSVYTPEQIIPNRKYTASKTILQKRKSNFTILPNSNKYKSTEYSLSATLSYRNMFPSGNIDADHPRIPSSLNLKMCTNSSFSEMSQSQSHPSLFQHSPNCISFQNILNNNKNNIKNATLDPECKVEDSLSEEKDSSRFATFFRKISELLPNSESKEEPVIYISTKLIKILSVFWLTNIEMQTPDIQLEIGCAIYFGMIANNKYIRKLFLGRKVGPTSMQFLDMVAWLIRMFMDHENDQTSVKQALVQLSQLHMNMGIKQHFYGEMLKNIHETLQYYYAQEYTLQVKYAMDKLFVFAACILSNGNCNLKFAEKIQLFGGFSDVEEKLPAVFLSSVDQCLLSSIGREFLYMFLTQTYCDEIVVFLQLLYKFEHQTTDKERFMTARNIIQTSIDPKGGLPINISYDVRNTVLKRMVFLENSFMMQKQFEIEADFFFECFFEVKNLILNNQWTSFVKQMNALQRK